MIGIVHATQMRIAFGLVHGVRPESVPVEPKKPFVVKATRYILVVKNIGFPSRDGDKNRMLFREIPNRSPSERCVGRRIGFRANRGGDGYGVRHAE